MPTDPGAPHSVAVDDDPAATADAAGDAEPASSDAGTADDIPSRLRELGSYIRSQRRNAQLSLRKLARIAGVSNPYLSQIERGLRKPSAEILQAIAKALEISSETLYVKAGILEEREGDPDVESAVVRDPHLTEPQRRTLIEMYRSFRRLSELEERAETDRRPPLRGLVEVAGTREADDEDPVPDAGEPEADEA